MKQKEFDIFTQSALNRNKIWYIAIYTLINIIILDRNVINLLNLHWSTLWVQWDSKYEWKVYKIENKSYNDKSQNKAI